MIEQLAGNCEVFRHLFKDLSIRQARWKPEEDRWSQLEVINHLYDEEREDFRQRLKLVLKDPQTPWPPIDPEAWVVERGYNQRNLNESLLNFFAERIASLKWLNGLPAPDWQAAHDHPRMGLLSAEQILVNWVAHDLFHIRQATDLHFAWLTRSVAPLSLSYSGWEI